MFICQTLRKDKYRDSEAYKLLKNNGMDTSPLEGN